MYLYISITEHYNVPAYSADIHKLCIYLLFN